jgi:hypothetical protein
MAIVCIRIPECILEADASAAPGNEDGPFDDPGSSLSTPPLRAVGWLDGLGVHSMTSSAREQHHKSAAENVVMLARNPRSHK